jgi:hypothetical protein
MAIDTTLKLTEQWEVHGEWWLPGDETVLSAGTLVYDPNSGAKLINVVGALAKNHSTGEGPEIILGQTNRGAVTLAQTHCERTSSLIPDADFAVELVITKRHFNSVESIRFNKFHVRYANLNKWIERGNPVYRVRKSFCGILKYIVPTKWSSLWDLTHNTTKIRLRVGQGLVVGGGELTFSQIHDHQFTYEGPTGPEIFYQDERSIRSLLDILSNAQMQVERIWGEDSILRLRSDGALWLVSKWRYPWPGL